MKWPRILRASAEALRAGGGFDTRIGRDHDAAGERRAEHEIAAILSTLEVVGLPDPDTAKLRDNGGGAAMVIERLWPKPPTTAAEHNDLAVALAWQRQWDKALAQLMASELAKGATEVDRNRASCNRTIVLDARTKANG